jgi:hypothetical protein
MRRAFICWVVFCAVGSGWAQKAGGATNAPAAVQPAAVDVAAGALSALETGNISAAEKLLPDIKNPAAKLYVQACIERAKGDANAAIQSVAKSIVLYYNDREWIAKSEMLSAELYLELGLLDAADVTAKQVQALYPETDVAKAADALCLKIMDVVKQSDKILKAERTER